MGGGCGKYVPPENYFLDNWNAEVLLHRGSRLAAAVFRLYLDLYL